ncbi:MAG TPA: hypothetical protein DCS21_02955 [Gammaproteobacteria bacterium]|nr:hypothetical protein [Gammaproteobacteria bacterium]
MTLALRSHAIVDNNHTITLPGLELKPGVRVEVIVLVENEVNEKSSQSFLDAIAGIEIDTPPDYSTTF